MSRIQSAPVRAAWMLKSAARHLETVDPNPVLGSALEDAFSMERHNEEPLTPQFAESAPGSLSLLVHPGGSARDRLDLSAQAMRSVVGRHFGRDAARWLEGRIEPAFDGAGHAVFGGGFDREGVAEGVLGFDLRTSHVDTLPPALARITRIALALLPNARVVSTLVRCGRQAGSQQVTVEPGGELALATLRPLMNELGLGHQHASLMSSTAFLLGARFTFPAGSVSIMLRRIRNGVEMRLDVALEHLPDPPPQLLSLLRLWMTERPRAVAGLDRWLSAFTPEGFRAAGDVTVLSVWVRPEVPARMALFLRPAAMQGAQPEPVLSPVNRSSLWD